MPEAEWLTVGFIDLAWIGWALLWLALALDVKRTVRHEPVLSRIGHLAPLCLAALLLVAHLPGLPWLNAPLLPRQGWMAPGGAVLVAVGLTFAIWARRTIGRDWSGTVTVKQAHRLVLTGPYALARHPIYTGLLTAFFGTAMAIDAPRGVLALVLATAAFLRKSRMEEKFMVETFGQDYAAYSARTASLVPFLW